MSKNRAAQKTTTIHNNPHCDRSPSQCQPLRRKRRKNKNKRYQRANPRTALQTSPLFKRSLKRIVNQVFGANHPSKTYDPPGLADREEVRIRGETEMV